MLKLNTRGVASGDFDWTVGVATRRESSPESIRLIEDPGALTSLGECRAVVSTLPSEALKELSVPAIAEVKSLKHIQDGNILLLTRSAGMVNTLYRSDSDHNVLFITDRCNSNCLMCSQPPIDHDDSGNLDVNAELIRLMNPVPKVLGITGGEPTLLRERFLDLLIQLREKMPDSWIHMLTNGRAFAWKDFTRQFAQARHPKMTLGIPLYSDLAPEHDYVVQARGAFDQTVMGIHQLARHQQSLEIRVVLHKQTCGRIGRLAQFIYRNMPFVNHVALMGLEMMGYVRRNYDLLWVDPSEYQDELEEAVEFLTTRGMNVSIYNHQLCLLRPSLWKFAKRSISDWKNIYLDECQRCSVRDQCGGLFKSAAELHSPHIKAIKEREHAKT
ncbi:MAG: His-Xaa-Ser system radical SAM maturase HxsC [Vulcanimicrobiota bacterium]